MGLKSSYLPSWKGYTPSLHYTHNVAVSNDPWRNFTLSSDGAYWKLPPLRPELLNAILVSIVFEKQISQYPVHHP